MCIHSQVIAVLSRVLRIGLLMESDAKKQHGMSNHTALELEILMFAYSKNISLKNKIIKKQSNMSAAAKEQKLVWQHIADRVTA